MHKVPEFRQEAKDKHLRKGGGAKRRMKDHQKETSRPKHGRKRMSK